MSWHDASALALICVDFLELCASLYGGGVGLYFHRERNPLSLLFPQAPHDEQSLLDESLIRLYVHLD